MNPELLNLPLEIQLALAGGFAGYAVGYAGRRRHHGQVEIVMISLGFGLVALLTMRTIAPHVPVIVAAAVSFSAAIIAGAAWRGFIRQLVFSTLRASRVSAEDGLPTVIETVAQDMRYQISILTVRTRSGRVLHCERVHDFRAAPHGPCLIGEDGSIGLYVTQVTTPDGTEHPWTPERDGQFQMTVVPGAEVVEVDIWRA